MIHAIGLDIVEVARIVRDLDEYGNRFRDRILGARERELYDRRADKAVFLAGRFAAKEAVIKALGYRLTERPAYGSLEILNDGAGQPVLELPEEIRAALGSVRILLSITHERTHAAAVAVIEGG